MASMISQASRPSWDGASPGGVAETLCGCRCASAEDRSTAPYHDRPAPPPCSDLHVVAGTAFAATAALSRSDYSRCGPQFVLRCSSSWLGAMGAGSLGFHGRDAMGTPGRGTLSGTYTGPAEIFGLWKRIAEHSGGGLQLELRDVLANDDRAVVLVSVRGRRADRELDARQVAVFEFAHRVLRSATFIYEDPQAYEAFWH